MYLNFIIYAHISIHSPGRRAHTERKYATFIFFTIKTQAHGHRELQIRYRIIWNLNNELCNYIPTASSETQWKEAPGRAMPYNSMTQNNFVIAPKPGGA
jgi:hypothetical protein